MDAKEETGCTPQWESWMLPYGCLLECGSTLEDDSLGWEGHRKTTSWLTSGWAIWVGFLTQRWHPMNRSQMRSNSFSKITKRISMWACPSPHAAISSGQSQVSSCFSQCPVSLLWCRPGLSPPQELAAGFLCADCGGPQASIGHAQVLNGVSAFSEQDAHASTHLRQGILRALSLPEG